jgi:NifB/MoaA-like Fe-S oxidoreductase
MNTCRHCSRAYEYDRKKGHGQTCCNTCYISRLRLKKKSKLIENFGSKCKRCGYGKSVWSLQFHHRDPLLKQFSISTGINTNKSYRALLEEANKCDLVCANCHGELEEEIWKTGRSVTV